MKRNKHIPLTETVYYILLVLFEPAHGYLIMQNVEELSQGEVRMAAGTLYGASENLLKWGFIETVESKDKRRKVYVITEKGKQVLCLDHKRMKHMSKITDRKLLEEGMS